MKEKKMKAFVYGSLKSGYWNNRLLETSKLIGPAKTKSKDFTLHELGAFPGLLRGGNTQVIGELYEITPEVRDSLDRLENHPNMYKREEDVVLDKDGNEIDCELYIYQGRPDNVIESGEWKSN